jgi:hypothetical protein
MIDLEEALAPLVERAPVPPAVESVARRGRQHRRRRTTALVAALVLVAVIAGGAISTVAGRDGPRVLTPPNDVEHMRVTLLDGSRLDISGPASLRLTELPLSFSAELDYIGRAPPGYDPGHSFSVSRSAFSAATRTGVVLGRYPTADGHELVVYETFIGTEAVVRYGEWYLIVQWSDDRTEWGFWASGLRARENGNGFLVVDPAHADWRVGPTDAPDVQLGDDYMFFGHGHPGCFDARMPPDTRCNADRTVLTRAVDPALADTLDEINVELTPPPGL